MSEIYKNQVKNALEMLWKEQGFGCIEDVYKKSNMTRPTVRKYLKELEEDGFLKLTRKGAVLLALPKNPS